MQETKTKTKNRRDNFTQNNVPNWWKKINSKLKAVKVNYLEKCAFLYPFYVRN